MKPPSELPFASVASYSKVLSIFAPDDYAIFDGRVAAALNAIMMIAGPEKAILSPYLPSRNVATGRFMADHPVAATAAGAAGWSVIPISRDYRTYLETLRSVLPAGTALRDLEMCLFSQTPQLVLEEGKHRGLALADLAGYRDEKSRREEAALDELARLGQEFEKA